MTPKPKRQGWPEALVEQIVRERNTMTLDALAERHNTSPAWISVLLKRSAVKRGWEND